MLQCFANINNIAAIYHTYIFIQQWMQRLSEFRFKNNLKLTRNKYLLNVFIREVWSLSNRFFKNGNAITILRFGKDNLFNFDKQVERVAIF